MLRMLKDSLPKTDSLTLLRQHYDLWVRLGLSEEDFLQQRDIYADRCKAQGVQGYYVKLDPPKSSDGVMGNAAEWFKSTNNDLYQMWARQGDVVNKSISGSDMKNYFIGYYSDAEKRRPQTPDNRFKVYCAVNKALEEILFFAAERDQLAAYSIDRYVKSSDSLVLRRILSKHLSNLTTSKRIQVLFTLASYFQGFMTGMLELSDEQALFKGSNKAHISLAYLQMLGPEYALLLLERYCALGRELDEYEQYLVSKYDMTDVQKQHDAVTPLLDGVFMIFSNLSQDITNTRRTQQLKLNYKYNQYDSDDTLVDTILDEILGNTALFPSYNLWKCGSMILDEKEKADYFAIINDPHHRWVQPYHTKVITKPSLQISTTCEEGLVGQDFKDPSPNSVAAVDVYSTPATSSPQVSKNQYLLAAVRAFLSFNKQETMGSKTDLQKMNRTVKRNIRLAREGGMPLECKDFMVSFPQFLQACQQANYDVGRIACNYGFEGLFSTWSMHGFGASVTLKHSAHYFGWYHEDEFLRPQVSLDRVNNLHRVLMMMRGLVSLVKGESTDKAVLLKDATLAMDLGGANNLVKRGLQGVNVASYSQEQLHAVLCYFYKFMEKMLDVSQDVPLFIIKQAVISHVRVSALQFLTIDIKRLCDLLCDYIELLRQLEQANPQRYPFDSSVAMLLPLLRTLKFYTHFVLNQPEHMERFAALPGYNDNSQTQTLFPSIMNSMLAEGKPAGDLLIQLLSCGVFKSFSLWREKYQGLLSYVSHTGNVNASASTVFSPKKKASKKSSNVRLFTQTGRSSSPRPAKKKKVSPKIPSDRNVVKDSLRQSFSSVAKSSKVVHTNELIIEAGVSQSDLLERITQSHRKIVRRLTTLGVIALEQESSEDDLSSAACGSSPTL